MSSQNQNNIYPKSCNYGCNTQIYWNSSVNEYWEVFTQKKHICPNRVNKTSTTSFTNNIATTTANKLTCYSKKPWNSNQQTKPKMSNSFELLTGPTLADIQKKYEILSDLVTEYCGKTHGSQSHNVTNNSMQLIVYYEVPLGQRKEVKRKFENFILSESTIRNN
jgi:hypothetical protein